MHTYLWSGLPDLFYSKAPVGRYRNENDDKYSNAAGPKGTAIIILIFIGLSFKHLHLAFRRAFFLPDEGHLKHILTSSDKSRQGFFLDSLSTNLFMMQRFSCRMLDTF